MLLLTGASGYLGSQILQELARLGTPLRLLARDPSRFAAQYPGPNPQVVCGDLKDPHSLEIATRGVKQIIHTAAFVRVWAKDSREFWKVNVEGLQNLLRAAEANRVERIVYTSSFIALGPSADVTSGEELRHPEAFSNAYEQTKAEALEWLRHEGFRRYPVVALLPGVIYGPGPMTAGNLTGAMIKAYLAGRFPAVFGSGTQRWSFAFNRDVVRAHIAALTLAKPGREYILGGDNRSLNEFYRVLSQVSGVQRKLLHLPFALGKLAGYFELFRAHVGGEPALTPGVVEIFQKDWVYSSARAMAELGYVVTPLEEGLRWIVDCGQ